MSIAELIQSIERESKHTHLESFSTKKEENNKDKQASVHAVNDNCS